MKKLEQLENNNEFEQNNYREIERKFMPLFPEQLDDYRTSAIPIEQYYLSHPDETFSLRLRETFHANGELVYEATLKDSGSLTPNGIDRLEVTTRVHAELYHYFKQDSSPILRKLRAEPLPGITIDFFEDGSVQVESEDATHWQQFIKHHGDSFIDITGDHLGSNEWRAHVHFRRANSGKETLRPLPELDTRQITLDILARQRVSQPVIVHIGGRSGSGKSTIVSELQQELEGLGISSTVMSTDDYHRGESSLQKINNGKPWEHWDEPVVYDTSAMAVDLEHLYNGERVHRRTIDWNIVEPSYNGIVEPCDVVIIEGIYALSPDITKEGELRYEMTTPLATCVGRRLLRDMRERPEFADPVKALEYMLREAEPAYRRQAMI